MCGYNLVVRTALDIYEDFGSNLTYQLPHITHSNFNRLFKFSSFVINSLV